MASSNRVKTIARYVIAIGAVLLAWLLRELLTPLWGPNALPFIFFFPAVVLATWYARLPLAILSIGLSAVAANYYFIEPRHTLWISNLGEFVGLLSFVCASLVTAMAIESMHRANARERRATEEARRLDAQSAHLAAIVTSSADAIVSKTLQGVVTSWNDGARLMFGYTASEMIGQPILRLIPEELQAEENFILSRLRAGERVEHFETVRMHKNGTRLDVSLTISPIRNSEGTIIGASKIARDITDRKQAERWLRENIRQQEALYTFVDRLHRSTALNEVYEAALDAIIQALACDRASILLYDNADVMRFVASRGLSDRYRAAVEGHTPWTRDAKDSKPISIEDIETSEVDEALKRTVLQEGVRSLHFIPLALGSELIGKFMTYYNAPHVATKEELDLAVSIARQLAFSVSRIRTEGALRENEERLRLATDTGRVGVWDWDIKAGKVSWTDSLYSMHGLTKEDFDGKLESFAALIHPEDREMVLQAIRASVSDGSPYELEFRILKPTGETIWIFTSGIVFRENGESVRMIGATVDITERKAADAEREWLLAREQELRLVAEESNRLKDEFLATMSHELRNPLNVILGYSELLLRADEIKNSPQLLKMGEALRRNALAQSHLIRDLLDLSRLRSGKLALNAETVSLMTAVTNAVETVRADALAKNIKITIEMPDEALFVQGDLLRLEQIVWNLLTNSVKFTPTGGSISVRTVPEGSQIVLTVTDTGEGIEAAFLPHVFEMFRQADASTSRAQSGMGIGLALVRQLVELHGGVVSVQSGGRGLGTSVTVRLPRSAEATAPVLPVMDLTPSALSKLGVLVLDDSEDTIEMLRALLEQGGARVTTATNGLEALRIASQGDFDVVLSDISMPGMDGFEFVRRLRELPGKKDVPVLALTGFGRPEDINRAQNEGFFSHLTKPFDLTKLSEILKNVPTRKQ